MLCRAGPEGPFKNNVKKKRAASIEGLLAASFNILSHLILIAIFPGVIVPGSSLIFWDCKALQQAINTVQLDLFTVVRCFWEPESRYMQNQLGQAHLLCGFNSFFLFYISNIP